MSYESAVSDLYALGHELAQVPARKFDLSHMRTLLQELGHPEKTFPSILIAGTNGKGSTAATMASILLASGMRTALYTSPHLIRVNERIRINHQAIADDDFGRLYAVLDDAATGLVSKGELPWHPSFFEMLTAIAFQYFSEQKADIAVLEVGMGGRLDATNSVEPVLSVIADIALDHQQYLGDTIKEISREKAGIIRHGGIVVTLPQLPEANDIIGNAILERQARGVSAVPYVPPVSPNSSKCLAYNQNSIPVLRYPVSVLGSEILVETPLVGRHQYRNVALAIAAAEELNKLGYPVSPKSIATGIASTHWPGRFQVVPATAKSPEIVIDVAHNPAGAWALRSTLSEVYPERPLVMIFGAMRDKAIGEIAEILFPLVEHVVLVQAGNPRSATFDEIRSAASRTAASMENSPSVDAGLARARQLVRDNGVIVITGSIYVVGEVMQSLGLQA